MARKATGELTFKNGSWHGRFWTTVEGERMRVRRKLNTANKAVARRRMQRMMAEDHTPQSLEAAAQSVETFEDAAERVHQQRLADGVSDAKNEISRLRRYAFGTLGERPVVTVVTPDVNQVLEYAKTKGKSKQTVQHLKQDVLNVFVVLKREGVVGTNPASEAELPRFQRTQKRTRAVLEDHELFFYLQYTHEMKQHRNAVAERQAMSCVAATFGGSRTGDLYDLEWSTFSLPGFEWGWAPRSKQNDPCKLPVPPLARAALVAWWKRQKCPTQGLVFPARKGKRIGERKTKVSQAKALRRDLQNAFKQAAEREIVYQDGDTVIEPPAPGSPRWTELFDETTYTRPVDFHSWRRFFCQNLGDANVNEQTARALAGHSSLAAHARYLANATKAVELPAAAQPQIDVEALEGPLFSADSSPEAENLNDSSGRDRSRTRGRRRDRHIRARNHGENSCTGSPLTASCQAQSSEVEPQRPFGRAHSNPVEAALLSYLRVRADSIVAMMGNA